MLEPWQWFIGANEFVAAWYVTVHFLAWRRHRAVIYDEREGQPPLTEHQKWIAEQDAKKPTRRIPPKGGGGVARPPKAHKCVRCDRKGSMGIYVNDVGGWLCINCIHAQMPEKTKIWQQQQLQYRQENGIHYWESGVYIEHGGRFGTRRA